MVRWSFILYPMSNLLHLMNSISNSSLHLCLHLHPISNSSLHLCLHLHPISNSSLHLCLHHNEISDVEDLYTHSPITPPFRLCLTIIMNSLQEKPTDNGHGYPPIAHPRLENPYDTMEINVAGTPGIYPGD